MKPVRITKLAQTEIDAAANWFERRKEGLGIQFYKRVAEAIEKVERNPEGFQKLYKDMRHVNLEQFKEWGLFFRILADNSVVIACVSGRRNTRLIRERASGVIPIQPE